MAGSNKDANNGLKVLIVFLVIAVVGLVAGVVVVNVQKNDQPKEIVKTDNEIYVEVANSAAGMSAEEALKFLDEQMRKYEGKTSLVYDIAMIKIDVYKEADMFDDAISFLEELSNSNLDIVQEANTYCVLGELYEGTGNNEKKEYFFEKCQEYGNVGYEL